ncbi:MAG: hypothetical protein BGO90_12290 [Legionella sp. 40-6]|nr:thioredoxin family protein [Legionella sp.]OJY43984.1 MAG: hypothetical protein BGO90_12290 [Legionella sp. 40-6]
MVNKRKIEIFSAGCPTCQNTVDLVDKLACSSCEIEVLDMRNPEVAKRAERIGIKSVPAIVVNGELASCCAGQGPSVDELHKLGIGQPL